MRESRKKIHHIHVLRNISRYVAIVWCHSVDFSPINMSNSYEKGKCEYATSIKLSTLLQFISLSPFDFASFLHCVYMFLSLYQFANVSVDETRDITKYYVCILVCILQGFPKTTTTQTHNKIRRYTMLVLIVVASTINNRATTTARKENNILIFVRFRIFSIVVANKYWHKFPSKIYRCRSFDIDDARSATKQDAADISEILVFMHIFIKQ